MSCNLMDKAFMVYTLFFLGAFFAGMGMEVSARRLKKQLDRKAEASRKEQPKNPLPILDCEPLGSDKQDGDAWALK